MASQIRPIRKMAGNLHVIIGHSQTASATRQAFLSDIMKKGLAASRSQAAPGPSRAFGCGARLKDQPLPPPVDATRDQNGIYEVRLAAPDFQRHRR